MSADALAAVRVPGSDRAAPAGEWPIRALVYFAVAAAAVGWTLALGRDLPWDGLNYHLYLGYSALNDRFAQDFFAAGTPSYLNPYAYVPLYLMTSAGLPAALVAIALATVHAALLWLTYELALVALGRCEPVERRAFAVVAVVLAATNPILIQGIGATYVDIPIGILVVGAWLALAHALRQGGSRIFALAGALAGCAAALKLSNVAFALAAVPALAFVPGTAWERVRAAAIYGAACAVAFVAVAGPWAWQLWREFANPLFPFLNQWFASPDFTSVPLRPERFRPASFVDALLRPFELLSPRSLVQTEPRAPDARYAAGLVLGLALLAAWAFARRGAPPAIAARLDRALPADAADRRVFAGLLAGFACAWVLWLAMSGNGRYFVAMSCVASVLLALLLQRLHRAWRTATLGALLLILGVQSAQLAFGTDWRRDGLAWSGPWMRVAVPERFRAEPHLYLSLGFLSGSAFAPHLHPRSGIVNVSGFYVLGPGHPGGARTQALIDRQRDRLRVLMPLPFAADGKLRQPGPPENLSLLLRRFGLRVDATDCDYFSVDANLRGIVGAAVAKEAGRAVEPRQHFLTCRLLPAPEAAEAYAREVRDVDVVFDRVEDACPNLFHPRRPVTEQRSAWFRTYHMGSELQLWIEGGTVKYSHPVAGGDAIEIGTVAQWTRAPLKIDCSRKSAPAFGGVLER